jgi:hypothetical protein
VQWEFTILFLMATQLVEVQGMARKWNTLREFLPEVFKYYQVEEKRAGRYMKYEDFEAAFLAMSGARYRYEAACKAAGKVGNFGSFRLVLSFRSLILDSR